MNIGSVVHDKYRITGFLGEGAVGVVYLAEHLALDRLCAIKVLKHNLLQDQVAVERFRREALAASRLLHPNIVSVFDFGQLKEGSFFFAMEYVRGRPLNQVIQGVGLDVERACRLLRQLADALAYAHGNGVVHRDIKPDNVMLDGYPHKDVSAPKILDFGLAKFIRERLAPITVKGQLFGTPEYMAPEQIVTAEVDHRTDIYSFGAMAFEVLTGRTPFAGGFLEQLTAHRRESPPRPSDVRPGEIPPELDAMVLRCMAKKPSERYDSALEVVAVLDAVLADRAVRRSFRGSSGELSVAKGEGPEIADALGAAERICDDKWDSHGEVSRGIYRMAMTIAEQWDGSDGLALALAQAVVFEESARGLRSEICGVLRGIERVRRDWEIRKGLLLDVVEALKKRRQAKAPGRSPELERELDRQIDTLIRRKGQVEQDVESVLDEHREWLAVLVRRFLQARRDLSDYVAVLARMVLDAREHLSEIPAGDRDWERIEELVSRAGWQWADEGEGPGEDAGT